MRHEYCLSMEMWKWVWVSSFRGIGMRRGRRFAGIVSGAVVGILAAGAAHAPTMDFEHSGDPVGQSFSAVADFTTNGGAFNFHVDPGTAVVDTGTGLVVTPYCGIGQTCSDSGSHALYVFGGGTIRLTAPSSTPGFNDNLLNVTGFLAAIATLDPFVNPPDPNTFDSQIVVSGKAHTGSDPTPVTIPLLGADPNYTFLSKDLTGLGFTGLDYLEITYDAGSLVTNNSLSGDFAIDNIDLTTTAGGPITLPPSIPEPGTLGLLAAGLLGLGLTRKRAKRRAA